jgi:hypothetical protein
MDYPQALTAISLGLGGLWSASRVVGSFNGKKVCGLHAPLMSDIVSIKNAMVQLTVYMMKEAEKEGRDLQQEIINAMMKK